MATLKSIYDFSILRDDTVALVATDYVVWACGNERIDYKMPGELRQALEDEINKISSMIDNDNSQIIDQPCCASPGKEKCAQPEREPHGN